MSDEWIETATFMRGTVSKNALAYTRCYTCLRPLSESTRNTGSDLCVGITKLVLT